MTQQDETPPSGHHSGTFSTLGITREAVDGLVKVVEGSTAVLFPPAQTTKKTSGGGSKEAGDGDEVGGGQDQSIFYNPAQVVNRDLSIAVLEVFSRLRRTEPARKGGVKEDEGITILEALSATGLRALRYWNEISGVRYVIANDMDADAVECIRRNAEYNGVPLLQPSVSSNTGGDKVNKEGSTAPSQQHNNNSSKGVIANLDDAIVLMQRLALSPTAYPAGSRLALVPAASCQSIGEENKSQQPLQQQDATARTGNAQALAGGSSTTLHPLLQQELMDVVDLDPYGTASPFLDAAFSCIKEGGLMLVTSTDSPILCGNYPDTCHAKYNSIMMKPAACHEVAVRILLAAAERTANKHRKYIVPLLSLHIDFYVRVFFRVYTQAAETKLATVKLAHVAHCVRCPAFWLSPMGSVRSSRKERARKHEATKRCRGDGSGAGNDGERLAEKERSAGEVLGPAPPPQLRSAAYPAPPDRSIPFKISCPTIDQWLPSDHGNLCPACGGHIAVGGPIYAAPTQNVDFLTRVLDLVEERAEEGRLTAVARVRGLVQAAIDELPDAPLFYSLPEIASIVRVRCPPTPMFVGAISRLGFRCSQVHCDPAGLKTTCPPETLISAMLTFKANQATRTADAAAVGSGEQEQGGLCGAPQPEDGGSGNRETPRQGTISLLLRPISHPPLDFSYDKAYDFRSSATGVSKFIPNAPGWGPKARHRGVARSED